MVGYCKLSVFSLAILGVVVLTIGNVTAAAAPAIEWQNLLGGSGNDRAYSIQLTSDGGYILTGSTSSGSSGDVGANHGGSDVWVVKLDSSGTLKWQKVLGGSGDEYGSSIKQTNDGGYILTGWTSSSNSGDVIATNHGWDDVWVVKLDSAGTILWQKVLGGSNYELGNSINQTSDGGYILLGRTASSNSGDVGQNHDGSGGSYDVWVVKLDSAGTLQWQKPLGGSEDDFGVGSIHQTSDGGYILCGTTLSSSSGDVGANHGGSDVWVVKLDSAGTILWQKPLGGSDSDSGRSIELTSDGGYILTAITSSSGSGDIIDPNHGRFDVWVVKLTSSGTIIWQKVLGGSDWDYGESIQQTSDGRYIIIGTTTSNNSGDVGVNHGSYDVWFVKLDSLGTLQWQKVLGGSGDEYGRSIQQMGDGGYTLTGSTSSSRSGDVGANRGGSDVWVVKLQELADLEISSGNITITPTVARPSDSVDIAAKITNAGFKNADNVIVQFFSTDSDNIRTRIGNDITVQKIPAGQTATVHATWTVEEGKFIKVFVDPLNSILEPNEENNDATRMSIGVEEIIVRLAKVQTDADINILIKNAKEMGAEGISVSFKDDEWGYRYYQDSNKKILLKNFILKAHKNSLKVYAWIPVFRDNLTHIEKVNVNPDWELKDKNRPSIDEDLNDFVNPVNSDVRKFQLAIITTIIEDYRKIGGENGIDGVRLDFCRFVDDWEDWNPASLQKFQTDTGKDPQMIDPSNAVIWKAWSDWRAYQVTSFIDEADTVIKTKDPDSDVGIYLLPFSVAIENYYDNSITGQDFEKIGPLGIKIFPMVYWQDWTSQNDFEKWTDHIIDNSRKKGGSNNIPVISITNEIRSKLVWNNKILSDPEVEKYLAQSAQIAQKHGANNISLFYYSNWGEGEKIRVQKALSFRPEYNIIKPIPGYSQKPTDPDGDGIYEDLNANGRLDFADVVLYFNQMSWIAENESVGAFDLNGNSRIDFADIVALFNEI